VGEETGSLLLGMGGGWFSFFRALKGGAQEKDEDLVGVLNILHGMGVSRDWVFPCSFGGDPDDREDHSSFHVFGERGDGSRSLKDLRK
jgi:hypothetical protein